MCPFSLRSDGALSKEDVVSPFVSPEVVSCKPISALGFGAKSVLSTRFYAKTYLSAYVQMISFVVHVS